MKIVAIFGDDEILARNRYFQIINALKKRGWEHIDLDSSKKMSEQLVTSSLFETERIYSLNKPQKVNLKEFEWINKHANDYEGSLLLSFGKTIPATIKKLLPKDTKYEEFKLPQKLFIFLESIYPSNAKNSLKLFHEVVKTNPAELIIAMIARHFKDLYTLKIAENSFKLPDWRKRKLQGQLSKFKGNTLEKFINDLSDADLKSKTGEGSITLLMDLILIKL